MQPPTNTKGQSPKHVPNVLDVNHRGLWAGGTEPLLSLPCFLKDWLPVKSDARTEILKKCSVIHTSYVTQLQAFAQTVVVSTIAEQHSNLTKTCQHLKNFPMRLTRRTDSDPNSVTARNIQAIKMPFLARYTALSGE